MKCKKCGFDNKTESKICENCGNKIKKGNIGVIVIIIVAVLFFLYITVINVVSILQYGEPAGLLPNIKKVEVIEDEEETVEEENDIKNDDRDFVIDIGKYDIKNNGEQIDLGTIKVDGKEYKLKYESNAGFANDSLIANDEKIYENKIRAGYIAVMDNKYIVINFNGTAPYRGGGFQLYNSDFEYISSYGGNSGYITSDKKVVRFSNKEDIKDNKTIIYRLCERENNGEYGQKIRQYELKFNEGKYSSIELDSIQNVNCGLPK